MLQFLRKKLSFQHLSTFSRPFWFLTIGSFLNRTGSFVMPFFVLYLTGQRGLSISEATSIVSLMGFSALGASFLGGMLSDKLGRRNIMLAELVLSGSVMFVMGYIHEIPLVIVCALLIQFLQLFARPMFAATVADVVPQEQRSQAYIMRYWINNIASAIGPVIAGLLAPISYLLLFIGDSLTTLLYAVLIWFGIPKTLPEQTKSQRELHQKGYLRTAFTDPLLWSYSLLALLFNCVYVQFLVALPLDMHAHGLNETYYGAILAVNAVEVVLIGLPLAAFFARIPQNTAMAISALMLGLGMGLYSWNHSLAIYALGVLIWTGGEIIYYPLSIALIAAISPAHQRGIYQGIFGNLVDISLIIGPLLGGMILQHQGATFLWTCCLLVGILTACSYLVLNKINPQSATQKSPDGVPIPAISSPEDGEK